MTNQPAPEKSVLNTDRELWRNGDDYYADSIHVTEGGGIGINVGGHVIVLPLKRWFAAAKKERLEASVHVPQTQPANVGVAVRCTVCGMRKKPVGRSAPLEMGSLLCDHECPGYYKAPIPGSLWPGEAVVTVPVVQPEPRIADDPCTAQLKKEARERMEKFEAAASGVVQQRAEPIVTCRCQERGHDGSLAHKGNTVLARLHSGNLVRVCANHLRNYLLNDIEILDQASAVSKESAPRWIPVGERLPDIGEQVLACNDAYPESFQAERDEDMWFAGEPDDEVRVTHWMPLPNPPLTQREEARIRMEAADRGAVVVYAEDAPATPKPICAKCGRTAVNVPAGLICNYPQSEGTRCDGLLIEPAVPDHKTHAIGAPANEIREVLAAVVEGYDLAISSHPAEFVSSKHAEAFAKVIARAEAALKNSGFGQ